MPEFDANSPEGGAAAVPAVRTSANTGSATRLIPQFAIDAADQQVTRVSSALDEAADAIDRLVADNGAALPEPISEMVRAASEKLRGAAATAGQQDAEVILNKVQQLAARNPATTIGIGAALGAALGLVITRLGSAPAVARNA
jgi:ElaB/YqjD/DUF883 family membrane-anchored ribosome-binding protein